MFDMVISGGDSFTFGAELQGSHDPVKPHEKSWANLVAQKIGKEHINTAKSGRSNSFIARHVLHNVSKIDLSANKVFVQVMWTFADRNEFALAIPTADYDSPWIALTPYSHVDESESDWFKRTSKNLPTWKSVYTSLKQKYEREKQLGIVDFAAQYNRLIQTSPINDSYNSVKEVLLLQNTLEQLKVPYLFTYVNKFVMNGLFSDAKRTPGAEYVNSLRSLINKDKWFNFPNSSDMYQGFDDWARSNNYNYATSHPLDNAHKDASELIYNHIKNNFFE